MRTLWVVCLAIGTALVAASGAQEPPQVVTPPPEVIAALGQVSPSYLFFPSGAASTTAVAPERVPADVTAQAADWMKRVVRPMWLPEDLAERLHGATWAISHLSPGRFDVLTAEYSLGGGQWSVSECGTKVVLLWHNANIVPGEDPANTTVLIAQMLLNVPEEEAPKMRADLKEVPGAGLPLFCGQITVPIEPLPREQWENTPLKYPYWHMQWYHRVFVWIAPGYFYMSVRERTGQPVTNPQARPGSPPRFLPAPGDPAPAPPAPAADQPEEPSPAVPRRQ